ncbi:MAG: SET domain-containing protein-lysine N-methyltransferase [Deltaproteobacteria bacterium]|nr:SET domain-containing protein-lysine N-methyltransferase [Deltaproteobacteria bacterium]
MAKGSKRRLPMVYVDESGIHGDGLFAGERIRHGRRIIEYTGEKIPSGEGTTRSRDDEELTYIFTLNDKFDVDGSVNGNEARFANHSCDGNTYVDIIRGRIWFIAEQTIEEGEEITFDYRLQGEELYECICGTARCRGYMNDKDDELVKAAKAEKRRA